MIIQCMLLHNIALGRIGKPFEIMNNAYMFTTFKSPCQHK